MLLMTSTMMLVLLMMAAILWMIIATALVMTMTALVMLVMTMMMSMLRKITMVAMVMMLVMRLTIMIMMMTATGRFLLIYGPRGHKPGQPRTESGCARPTASRAAPGSPRGNLRKTPKLVTEMFAPPINQARNQACD